MWTNASKMVRAAFGAVLLVASTATADIVSDQSGAILVFPKIVVDTTGDLGDPTDTVIQITNTSNSVISARCFYVNATGHCSNNETVACTEESAAARCGAGNRCVPQWTKRDFRLTLTKRQPLAWRASEGLPDLPCDGIGSPDGFCPFGQSNIGADGSVSSVPLVAEDPFYGQLTCVQVDPESFEPSAGFNPGNGGAGDLKGEATIISDDGDLPDARKVNAVALKSTTTNDQDDVLRIGGANAEYEACPHVLILNHTFDNATVTYGAGQGSSRVTNDLTVMPCSQDYLTENADGSGGVLQFLIFNEFEQRFSAATTYDCWREIPLSDIDTRPGSTGDSSSIFSASVQGTITGQTRIRPVGSGSRANGVLAIAEEAWNNGGSRTSTTAANLHFAGETTGSDQIILSPDSIP